MTSSMSDLTRFTLDSSRERWLSDGLCRMSIGELDDFFRYFATCVCRTNHSTRKKKDVVFASNRIAKQLVLAYYDELLSKDVIENWTTSDLLESEYDFLLLKVAALDYIVRKADGKADSDESLVSEAKSMVEKWVFNSEEEGGDEQINHLSSHLPKKPFRLGRAPL